MAELGHEVWARDIVPEKVESLARGEVPIHEPGLPELVAKNAERLHFTTDMGEVLENARLLFVCVDTPPTYSGDADLSRVEAVSGARGRRAAPPRDRPASPPAAVSRVGAAPLLAPMVVSRVEHLEFR